MLQETSRLARESVPFAVRTADGETIELTYSSPRATEEHDERSVIESLPWFEPGKPPHLVNYGFVRCLEERDFRIIEVPLEEYWDLAVNGVTLAPGKVVINSGSPTVVQKLEQAGVEVLQVDFSESQRFAIAGLHCATLELVRDQPGPLLD